MKRILTFVIAALLCHSYQITLTDGQSLRLEGDKCEGEKLYLSSTIQQMTVCTNDQAVLPPSSYKPLNMQYIACYRQFNKQQQPQQTISEEGKKVMEKVLREGSLWRDSIQDNPYTVQWCKNNEKVEKLTLNDFRINKQQVGTGYQGSQVRTVRPLPHGEVERKVWGTGFHQNINYTFTIPTNVDINEEQCSIVVGDVLPQTTYIDYDQLRARSLSIQTNQVINVQTPTYLAKQYAYKITIPFASLTQSSPTSYTYQQPIHFRYATPSNLTQYIEVPLHPADQIAVTCNHLTYDLHQNTDIYRGHARIPVGDKAMQNVVSFVTFLAELICALLLLKLIRK